MDADERDIYHYLSTWGDTFVNVKEICRRAGGKKRFGTEPDWAREPLLRMVDNGVVESDASSRYRLKPEKHDKTHQWIAPDIAKLLAEGGVTPEGSVPNPDENHEQL
ncbi:MAG: hypothetical protein RL616_1782 [Verrucomicrobiota bacterium]|jgi:hypothetical protein